MKIRTSVALILLVLPLLSARNGLAFQPPERPGLPDIDRRGGGAAVAAARERQVAVAELRAQVAGVGIDFNEVVGGPKWVRSRNGYLSGPGGEGKGISAAVAAGYGTNDPHRAVKAFLQEHRALFGHGPEALAAARTYREYVTPHNGMRTTLWQQELDGIEVYEAVFAAHTAKRGELIGITSQFLADPAAAADAGVTVSAKRSQPVVTAQQAVVNAAGSLDEAVGLGDVKAMGAGATGQEQRQQFTAGPFNQAIEARLVWLPMNPAQMRLCWEVTLASRARGETFRLLVDAQTGEVQVRRCLTVYLSEATYRVYTSDSPSPFSPGWSTPNSGQPALTSRVLVTWSALDTNASPNGWIDDGVNETRGNNVDAHTDRNADNVPDLPRPQGSPNRVFDFPMDLGQSPSTYTNAAVVQLFYWCNFMHDKLYELGFTEAAGNFQNNNFGRGGLGNDALQADAQDGSGYNNANFTPTPDGTPPRIQMYLFNGPTPYRDGDFDAEVVLHEYTHGLSERLVGGGVGISALQTMGMGEGWSDWYAMAVLSEAGDDVNGVYSSGAYVTYMFNGLTQNYYFGIRRYPYCTDMTKNPLTFKDIDPAQASAHTGIPRSPVINNTANEVHNMGEVWCMTLREARANLINKYGWAVGNHLILQLVTDGMKLSPANPNFLQARDSILQADQVDNGGADLAELWAAFAKRGMGYSATSPSSSTTTGLHEAFDTPILPLQVNLPASATEGDGVLANQGSVRLFAPTSTNLVVSLTDSDTSEITVPASVTVLAGRTNATFDITVVDDADLDGTQTSTVTASAAGYAPVTATMAIYDNESATLQVVLPATATEGQGTVTGTVYVSAVPAANIVVSLSSSDTTEIQVPVSVVIPSGQTSAVFTATVMDDNQIDGPQTATITAHVQNWTDGSASITVLDNENLNLTVTLPANAWENAGVLSNAGSICLSGILQTDLVVSVVSDTINRLMVPSTVTIFAGQISNVFNLTLVDNSVQDGDQTVTVTASAPGFTSGMASMMVMDDDTPPVIIAQPTNQTVLVGGLATFSVTATGSPPLNFQWNCNETNIGGATNSSLTLTNVQLNQAGNYAVLVTNVFGSVLSSNAVLTVNLPPPVPVITGFSPASATIGTVVTISGTNFSPVAASNIVYFGAVQAAVTVASVTNLTVTVPVGATYAPVTETVNGLTAYANQLFMPRFLGDGSGITVNSLASRLDLPVGSGPGQVVIADLDGDGKPDLIVANSYGNTISLYRNISTNGSLTAASFAPRVDLVTLAGSYTPNGIAAADVDGDGMLDIIAADYGSSMVSVYRNTCTPGNISSNSFATRVDFTTGLQPEGVAVMDLDGDGRPDLLVANSGEGTVSILRNTSVMGSLTTNSFAPKVDIATGSGCQDAAAVDWDGDGKPDVVTVNSGSGTLSLLRNISTPGSITTNSFAAKVDIAVLTDPVQMAIGDLDGDGKPDLTVTFYLPQTVVSVFRNISAAGSLTTNSFAPRIDCSLGGRGHTPAIGDLDGDGKPDIAVVTELSSLLSIFRNVSTPGSFTNSSLASRVDFSTGSNPWGVAIGDLDGDGRPDIIFCNQYGSTISIYQNKVPFGGPPIIITQPTNQTVTMGDMVTFSATASGTIPLSYQWCFGGTNVAGATNTSLTLTNVQFGQAGNYAVLVTNTVGSILSSNAVLAVNPPVPPTITSQPTNLTVFAGSSTNFSVTASGTPPLKYQWSFNGTNFSVATNATLTLNNIQMNQAGNYAVLVTNWGGSVLSSNAVLTVMAVPPAITVQPTNQTVFAGASPNLSVTATGTAPLIYQWQFNGSGIAWATNATLTLTNVQLNQAGNYTVLVTNAGGSILSSNALLTVNVHHFVWDPVSTPQVTNVPFAVTIRARDLMNGPITNFTGTVSISGMTTNCFGTNMDFEGGALAPWTPLNAGPNPGPYQLVSFDVNGDGAASTAFRIAANSGTADGITQNVSLTGGATYTVDMDIATDDLSGGNNADGGTTTIQIGGTNVAQFGFGSVSIGNIYRTNLHGTFSATTSGVYTVTLTFTRAYGEASGLWSLADDLRITRPGTSISILPTVTGNFTNGVWSGNMTVSNPGTNVVLVADDGHGHHGTSNPFNVISAGLLPAILAQPTNQTVFIGDAAAFGVTVGGAAPLSCQWRFNGTNISGATNAALSLTNVQFAQAGNYAVQVTNVYGAILSSNALLTVMAIPPTVVSQPASRTVLNGSNVTFTVDASGTPPLSYLWQKNGLSLAGASNVSFSLVNVMRTNSGAYNVMVTNIAGSVTSSNAILLVHVSQRLGMPVLLPDGTLAIASGDLDGGMPSASDLNNLQAQASTNLVDWVTLPGALTLTNDVLQLSDPEVSNAPMRFYRIIENW
jgi:hypothetical protein